MTLSYGDMEDRCCCRNHCRYANKRLPARTMTTMTYSERQTADEIDNSPAKKKNIWSLSGTFMKKQDYFHKPVAHSTAPLCELRKLLSTRRMKVILYTSNLSRLCYPSLNYCILTNFFCYFLLHLKYLVIWITPRARVRKHSAQSAETDQHQLR